MEEGGTGNSQQQVQGQGLSLGTCCQGHGKRSAALGASALRFDTRPHPLGVPERTAPTTPRGQRDSPP